MKLHGILGTFREGGRTVVIVRNTDLSYTIVEASYVDFDSVMVKKELANATSFDAAKAALRLLGGAHDAGG